MTSSDVGHSLQMVELKILLQRKQVTVSVGKPRLQLLYLTIHISPGEPGSPPTQHYVSVHTGCRHSFLHKS